MLYNFVFIVSRQKKKRSSKLSPKFINLKKNGVIKSEYYSLLKNRFKNTLKGALKICKTLIYLLGENF